MAQDAQAEGPQPNMSLEAQRARQEQGPVEVFLPEDWDDSPGLPPEVWPVPPADKRLPE